MILRELFEAKAKAKSVGIIFGRFNPPHMGHIKAWEMASENPAWYVGTNRDTQGPKDPLPYNVKVEVMKTMYPDLEGHLVSEISWLTLASKVYEKHGNIVLNVYTDEEWVTKTLIQYNGKEGQHGYYEFGTIQQQTTPRLSSATALRAAVMADDRQAFSQAAGVDADTPIAGHAFFDVVKHYLMPYAAKAAAKPVKKKVKQPEQDVVEHIVKVKGGYELKSKHGDKNLGKYPTKAGAEKRERQVQYFKHMGENVKEGSLGHVIPWPAVANKIGSAMKAMGWKAQRKGDDAFLFSTKGAEDESQYYMVMIDNEGDGMFSYALGTFEGGRPDIGEQGKLPTTAASVSEVLMAIRDGYGLDEGIMNFMTLEKPKVKKPTTALSAMRKEFEKEKSKNPDQIERGEIDKNAQQVYTKRSDENAWDRLQREKALESAGVGIITKQNSTVDVNKNTPKKNLKAFRLA